MKIRRYIGTATVICSLTLGITGSALADVSIDTTGAGSNQKVVMNNSSDVTVSNTNIVQVTNENVQTASTGNVNANENTSVGGAASGNASNNKDTTTTVAIGNVSGGSVLPVGGGGTGNGNGNGSNGGSTGSGTGSVLGASTVGGLGGGAAVLPEVGASVPVDVSALRAAWHPATTAPTAALNKGSRLFTGAMLLTATLLSVLGAVGSAWYAKRKEERV